MLNQINYLSLCACRVRFVISAGLTIFCFIFTSLAFAQDTSSALWRKCGIFTNIDNISTVVCDDEKFEKMENLFYEAKLKEISWGDYETAKDMEFSKDYAATALGSQRQKAYRKCGRDLNCIDESYAKETKKLETRIKGFENEIGEKIDCRGQLNPTDSFICKDPVLWSMEQKLRDMYFTGGGTFPQKVAWAQQKNNCSIKRTCLLRLYSRRIKELKPYQP
jgi:uncharacterized protein